MAYFRTLLVFFACTTTCWANHELKLLGGQSVQGQVVAVTDKDVLVESAKGPVTISLAELLEVRLGEPKGIDKDTKYHIVQLYDDSELYCQDVSFKPKKLEAVLLNGTKLELPLEIVVAWLRDAQVEKTRTQFRKFAKEKAAKDRLLVLREGELNPLPGVIGTVDDKGERVDFQLSPDKTIPVLLERVSGFLFFRATAPETEPVCMVVDVQGSVLGASKVTVKDKIYTITTLSGATLDISEAALAKLDFSSGKLRYLSDLPFELLKENSGANVFPVKLIQKDKGFDGQTLRIGNQTYKKGLALHSLVDFEYELGGKYKTFKAEVGMDPGFKVENRALVTVRCDGVVVYSKAVPAGEPQPIAVNIRDVNKLQITVSSSPGVDNFLNLSDHAVLGAARVTQ